MAGRMPRTIALTVLAAALAWAQPRGASAKGNEATVTWLGETLKRQAR